MAKSMPAQSGIFSKADYKTLIEARRLLNDLITTCDKAEQVGCNVAVWRQQMADIDQQLAKIHELFMTPAPTQ